MLGASVLDELQRRHLPARLDLVHCAREPPPHTAAPAGCCVQVGDVADKTLSQGCAFAMRHPLPCLQSAVDDLEPPLIVHHDPPMRTQGTHTTIPLAEP